MKLLPFRRRTEDRQQGPYTDAVTAAIIAASGRVAEVRAQETAAVEMAAGVIGRAFAAATVEGIEIDPSTLAGMARDMVLRGQAVYLHEDTEWFPAMSVEVQGFAARRAWRYFLEVPAPGGRVVRRQAYGWLRVLHARYSYDAEQPWIGIGPLQRAHLAGSLAANVERTLRDETSGTVGHVLPIPTDGADDSVDQLKADLGSLAGRTAIVETTAGGWGEGRLSAPRNDYQPQRIGPNPPQGVSTVYGASQLSVLAACGVPVELVHPADGTGQREAWRRFLHGTVAPLGRIIAVELTRLAARPVTIKHDSLFASDIAGRARAFQSLVGGGMTVGEAATQAGLLNMDG